MTAILVEPQYTVLLSDQANRIARFVLGPDACGFRLRSDTAVRS